MPTLQDSLSGRRLPSARAVLSLATFPVTLQPPDRGPQHGNDCLPQTSLPRRQTTPATKTPVNLQHKRQSGRSWRRGSRWFDADVMEKQSHTCLSPEGVTVNFIDGSTISARSISESASVAITKADLFLETTFETRQVMVLVDACGSAPCSHTWLLGQRSATGACPGSSAACGIRRRQNLTTCKQRSQQMLLYGHLAAEVNLAAFMALVQDHNRPLASPLYGHP
jgi:hypothetical protein